MKQVENFIGRQYGRLLVLRFSHKDKYNIYHWICRCICGNETIVASTSLKSGRTQSCGCMHKEAVSGIKNPNRYDLSSEFGIIYTSKGEEFYFDLEDYDKIKDYYWYKDTGGYLVTKDNNCRLAMHRLVMDCTDKLIKIDHKDRKRNNNRKNNLRFCTNSENAMNRSIQSNNRMGIIGVYYLKKLNRYRVIIKKYRKNIHIGYFNNFTDAIIARLKAEKDYFGEFAPQRHLFKKYGII